MNKNDNNYYNSEIKTPNIFKKMFLSFIIVPIIPIIALLISSFSSQQQGTELAEKNLINAVELIASNIDKWVEKNVYVSTLVSQMDGVVSMDPEVQKPILRKVKENSNAITAVRIDNAEGMAVSRSDEKALKNYADRIYFQQVLSGAPIGQQVIVGRTQKKPLLCFTVPINDEGALVGTFNQCATLDDISNNVTDLKIGETGFAFLVDGKKQLIATGNQKRDLNDHLQNMGEHPALKDGKLKELFTYEDNGKKIAYKTKVGLDWTLVVQQDYSEALAAPITTRNNTIVAVAITVLACLLFVYLLSRAISKPLQEARQETDNILSAVNDGLFLINKEYIIGTQQSSNLSEILQKDDLAGQSFVRYLSEAVPIDVAELAKDYIDLLFTDRIKESLIQTRNPLKLVKTSVENRDGVLESRYLSLTFKRVYEGKAISNLLVTAKDITQETLLKAELEKLREEKNQQVSLLSEILYIPSASVRKFLTETDVTLNKINDILELPGSSSPEYSSKLRHIYQLIHKIKGDAAAINFELFANDCHKFEEILQNVQNTDALTGEDFLPVTVALEELFKNCQVIRVLLDKIGKFGDDNNEPSPTPLQANLNSEWVQLGDMANRLAQKYEKSVEIHFQGFNLQLPEEYQSGFKDIATQLIRNSIVHGIESTKERERSSKIREGQITVSLKHSYNDGFTFIYKDDGRGINFNKVREKLLEKNIMSPGRIKQLTEKELLITVFKNGFSLAKEVNLDAGRGVGLPLVLEKVKELNGKIKVASHLDKGFVLKVTCPNISAGAQLKLANS